MSKTIKSLLIFITAVMLIISFKWYYKNNEEEPLISILGQFLSLLVLLFENKINASVIAFKNKRSTINVDASKESIVKVSRNEDSDIKIKTRP